MSLSVYFIGTLLSVGLATAQNLGTGSSYLGSSSHEQTASRLAQQGLLGSSTNVDSVNLNVSEVKDGMLVFIYNVDYRFTRLDMQGKDHCDASSGDVSVNQLWKLEEDPTRKGEFFIVNWAFSQDGTSYRYTGIFDMNQHEDDEPLFFYNCIGGKNNAKDDDQLWKFYKQSDGNWQIGNAASGFELGCFEDPKKEVHCGECNPYVQYPCHYEFRLQPAFASSALWFIAESVDNDTDQPIHYTVKYTEGITDTIEQTVAKSSSAEMSVSIGMEAPLEEIGLSMEETVTVQESFTESYARTLEKTWSVERTHDIVIPPHTRICLKQLKVNNVDNTNGIGFVFKSALYKLEQDDACN